MEKAYNKTQWENTPSTNTPINETNLNNIENGIDEIDSRVVTLSNTKSNVDWVQMQTDGKKIAEVTIDGVKKNVYVPRGTGGSGGASSWEDLEEKPFETLDNNNFNVSDGILSIKDKASGVEVSAIKESLTQFKDDGFLPKNLLNKSTDRIGIGMADNGTENTNGNAEMTEYIEVLPNRTCTISWLRTDTNMATRVALYDESKAFISLPIRDVRTEVSAQRYFATFNTTSNTKYLRANFSKAHKEIQIEYGNEMTEYSIYSISNTGLTQIVEDAKADGYLAENLVNSAETIIGRAWNFSTSSARAIQIVNVAPNTTYTIGFLDISNLEEKQLRIVEKSSRDSTDATVATRPISAQTTITTNANTRVLVIQYNKTNVSMADIKACGVNVQLGNTYVPSNTELKQSLSQLESVQSGSVTSTTNIASTVRMRLKKVGKVVSINFYFSLNAISDGLTNWYDLFQLPSGFFVSGTNVDFVMTDFDKNTFQAMISGTGMVRFVPRANISQGRLVLINLTYILD